VVDDIIGGTLAKSASQFKVSENKPKVQFANVPKPKTQKQLAVEEVDYIKNKNNATVDAVNKYNNTFGTQFSPQDLLGDAEKSAEFLNTIKSTTLT
jgi:hypothetical protein